jgi:Tol biopolymer transport system component
MALDGSDVRRVTFHSAADFASSWTTDGTRLVFETDRDGQWEVYSIGVDGTSPVRLTSHGAADTSPEWRP